MFHCIVIFMLLFVGCVKGGFEVMAAETNGKGFDSVTLGTPNPHIYLLYIVSW